tara:strand:+ start:150 stop:329 length:180 start_codon:yes stop_codon:yes gene_type:complete
MKKFTTTLTLSESEASDLLNQLTRYNSTRSKMINTIIRYALKRPYIIENAFDDIKGGSK